MKELRDRTGAGMMDCKKALAETDGDVEKAVELLRVRLGDKALKLGENVVIKRFSRFAVGA